MCGHADGPMVRRSVEKFDPATKTWTSVSDMILCRRNAGKERVHLLHFTLKHKNLSIMF